MRKPELIKFVIISVISGLLFSGCIKSLDQHVGQTEVKINGSEDGRFFGRSEDEIIHETASIKTNKANFFERASLIGFTGTSEALIAHSSAGSLFEAGKITEAYQIIDESFEKLRNGTLQNIDEVVYHDNSQDTTTWQDLKKYTLEGHEIASHSITHPRMAVLDEVNLRYELEQSKTDIYKHLGEAYRMPETYLDEINRASDDDPETSKNDYVQWQRGPLTNSSMELMKSWIDKCVANNNIWLILVFHGVDDFGWEPKSAGELEAYFSYIKENENNLWVATFADVTKYIRERKNIAISSQMEANTIVLTLTTDLDAKTYDVPLTLKTYIPDNWEGIQIRNSENVLMDRVEVHSNETGTYVLYDITPANEKLFISSSD